MNNTSKKLLVGSVAALVLALAGCAMEADPSSPPASTAEGTPAEATASTPTALTTFTFDTTALRPIQGSGIPAARLTARAFDDAIVRRGLVQSTEAFQETSNIAGRAVSESPSFALETDATSGHILALRTAPFGRAVVQDDAVMQRQAMARLSLWGVPSSEVGRVVQKRAMMEDTDVAVTGAPRQPEVHSYKTFAFRAVNGIPVVGHRAVITHGVDGSFSRALVKWPPLAASGHKLLTRLTPKEIETQALTALKREGETAGQVYLHWKYVPTALSTGEVVLTLKAGARMRGDAAGAAVAAGNTEEAREIDVDVEAQ